MPLKPYLSRNAVGLKEAEQEDGEEALWTTGRDTSYTLGSWKKALVGQRDRSDRGGEDRHGGGKVPTKVDKKQVKPEMVPRW